MDTYTATELAYKNGYAVGYEKGLNAGSEIANLRKNITSDLNRFNIEYDEDWRQWGTKIPDIHFKENWNVRIIPPFGGALARFIVFCGNKQVSVYFDAFSALGYMYDSNNKPIPYFEAYSIDGDAKRYLMEEIEEMMKDIEKELEKDD